jgi:hypothetical protein
MGEDSFLMQTMADPHSLKVSSFLHRNRLWPAVHPPYSPDLGPSDFFLFGHVKHSLKGMVFPLHEQFPATIHEIVIATRKRPYMTCLSTGWRDLNGFLRTMVTPIHTPNIGQLGFLCFLSAAEMLHLVEHPIYHCGAIRRPPRFDSTSSGDHRTYFIFAQQR